MWNEITDDDNSIEELADCGDGSAYHTPSAPLLSNFNNYLPMQEKDSYENTSYYKCDNDTTSESSTSTTEHMETWQCSEFSEHDKNVLKILAEKYKLNFELMQEDSWIDLTDEFNTHAELPRTTVQLKMDWDYMKMNTQNETTTFGSFRYEDPSSDNYFCENNEPVEELPPHYESFEQLSYPTEHLPYTQRIEYKEQQNEKIQSHVNYLEPRDYIESYDYPGQVIGNNIQFAEPQNVYCKREHDKQQNYYYEKIEYPLQPNECNEPIQYIDSRENELESPFSRSPQPFKRQIKLKRLAQKRQFQNNSSSFGRSKFVEFAYEKLKHLEKGLQYETDNSENDLPEKPSPQKKQDIEKARKDLVLLECEVQQENLTIKKLMIKKLLSEIKALKRQQ